jgi:shikimate dehydrogenase
MIGAETRYCAVYGHPVRHSASPAMQNAALATLKLDWRYLAFDVHPETLPEALAGAKVMHFVGLNLTVPHKLLAFELVDELDASAKAWGAVNTIRFEGQDPRGEWLPLPEFQEPPAKLRSHGFNTDADAIARALREDLGLELAGARVLVLGAGGAGRTAALKLAGEGLAELFLVNRTQSKARAAAGEIQRRQPGLKVEADYPRGEVDLVLNATVLGLRESDPLPFDSTQFSIGQARAFYDMIYRPAETPFLQMAKAAGHPVANGLGMLLYQGAKAFEIWTGCSAPLQVMREALQANIYG